MKGMKYIPVKMLAVLCFLFTITAPSSFAQQHKMKKDGKYKEGHHNVADHHNRAEGKKKKHKSEWKQHNQAENQTFSKKKKKKYK